MVIIIVFYFHFSIKVVNQCNENISIFVLLYEDLLYTLGNLKWNKNFKTIRNIVQLFTTNIYKLFNKVVLYNC
jgi:hypothetical protein